MSTPKYTLKSFERLKSQKAIGRLFDSGRDQYVYPFKLLFLIEDKTEADVWPLKFSVSIPKRRFKSAVDRNLLKRRTREAYRLNKILLQETIQNSPFKISLMFIFLEKEIKNYDVIDKSIKKHINEINRKVHNMG